MRQSFSNGPGPRPGMQGRDMIAPGMGMPGDNRSALPNSMRQVASGMAPRPANPAHNMLAAGTDIIPDKKNKRAKKGHCPNCGRQTHKIIPFRKSKPLTIKGLVYKGQCLECYPIEGLVLRPQSTPLPTTETPPQHRPHLPPQESVRQQQLPPQHHPVPDSGIAVPHTLELGFDDDSSYVSGITMDYQFGTNYDSPDEDMPPVTGSRPGPDDPFMDRRDANLAPPRRTLPSYGNSRRSVNSRGRSNGNLVPDYRRNPPLPPTMEHGDTRRLDAGVHPAESQNMAGPTGFSQQFSQRFNNGYANNNQYDMPNSDQANPPANVQPAVIDRPGVDRRFPNQPPSMARQTSSFAMRNRGSNGVVEMHSNSPAQSPPRSGNSVPLQQLEQEEEPPLAAIDRPGYDRRFPNQPPSMARQTNSFAMRNRSPSNSQSQSPPRSGDAVPLQELAEEEEPPREPRRKQSIARSIESGPSYQRDDHATPTQPHLVARASGPTMYAAGNQLHGAAAPPLQTSQTAAASFLRGNLPPGGMDSRISSESGGSFAPPLVSRDQRGRPDDVQIHDPMGDLSGMGNQDLEKPPAKAPSSYAPEFSPQVARPKSNSWDDELDGPSVFEDDDGRQAAHRTGQRDMHTTARKQPPRHTTESMGTPAMPAQAPSHRPPAASGGPPAVDRVTAMVQELSVVPQQQRSGAQSKQQSMQDIPLILHCLNLDEANTNLRQKALNSLADILWRSGDKAREFVLQHEGMDTLVKAMWEEIGIAPVQEAAADFLLAMAASSTAKAKSDMLTNEDSYCDALLFSMQMHANIEPIQVKGCCIFACLAAASSNNNKISDGTHSGALMMVLTAMSTHPRSVDIQRAGLQAVYLQCTLSSNAESNKRSLVETQVDNGSSGINVIVGAMQCLHEDSVAMEWACKLWWSLTSSEDLVESLSGMPVFIAEVMQACQLYLQDPGALVIVEASFGVAGNLAHVQASHAQLQDANAVSILIGGMRYHRNDYGVCYEACSALANLAASMPLRDSILKAGGVGVTIAAMQAFLDSPEFIGEAIRTLVCLSIHSDESKNVMAIPEVLGLITEASEKHSNVAVVQEMSCALIASLSVGHGLSSTVIENGGLNLIVRALGSNLGQKVEEAACVAYRNLSCQLQVLQPLAQKDMMKAVVKAMQEHENSVSIQVSACCSIWNLAYKAEMDKSILAGFQSIRYIVKAMQCHTDSGDLQELACGALWCLVDGSMERRKDVVGNGAIDAVACALMIHIERPTTLEYACGVLSSVSEEGPLAEAIAGAQCVSIVGEAMRNNGTALGLLRIGCMTLRNIVIQFPEFAQEASEPVSAVIAAMQNNSGEVEFLKEACHYLWSLAAEAESCQSKILALDGIAVLMQCLESENPKLQSAARGAFNELTAKDFNGRAEMGPC